MHYDILLTIAITSAIQSIFGIGVLLMGTPILLFLGYDFANILAVLLPVSLSINLFQINFKYIDKSFYFNIILYTIPPTVLLLFLVINLSININIFVGIFLILISCKELFYKIDQNLQNLIRYEKSFFVIMGLVHGLSNLGGSLLAAIIYSKKFDKEVSRATTALSYATFALFQLGTLFLNNTYTNFYNYDVFIYILFGLFVYSAINYSIYTKLNFLIFKKIFAFFLFCNGVVLIL